VWWGYVTHNAISALMKGTRAGSTNEMGNGRERDGQKKRKKLKLIKRQSQSRRKRT